jgi:hypothetical protein
MIMGWTYLKGLEASQGIVSKAKLQNGTNEWMFYWHLGSTQFLFSVYTNAGTSAATAIATSPATTVSNWHMFAAYINTTNNSLGLRIGNTNTLGPWVTNTYLGSPTNTDSLFRIGIANADGTWPLSGYVDELGLWNRVVSDSEITNFWNNGTGTNIFQQ